MFQQPKKVHNMPTDEELKKIKELDWDTYFRESHSEESMNIYNCPKCQVILVRKPGDTEVTCYNCGEKLKV